MDSFEKALYDNKPHICSECGERYKDNSLGEYKCPRCGHTEKDDYGKVRTYLEENGTSSAMIISAGTGVPVSTINRFLRQGKIEIPNGSESYIKCQHCGEAEIRFGRFCPACALEMTQKLGAALSTEDVGELPRNSIKMHFLDKKNN